MTSAQQLGRMSVLRKRGVVSILVAMCASRIAAGMIPFGLVTYFASRNDFASAGFSSTIFMIAVSLSGPVKSRIIQKYAPGVIIVSMAIISSVAFCLCIASSFYLHSTIFAFLLIALGAISAPPTGAVVRSAWNQISGSPSEKKFLHSIDSVMEEAVFALTPILTSIIWVSIGPQWGVPLGSIAGFIGSYIVVQVGKNSDAKKLFSINRKQSQIEQNESCRNRGINSFRLYFSLKSVGLLLPSLGIGISIGTLTIVLPAWASSYTKSQAISGVILGVISLSGAISASCGDRLSPYKADERKKIIYYGVPLTVSLFLFSIADNIFTEVLSAIMFGYGMTPIFVSSYMLVSALYNEEFHTELNASLGAAFNIGSGCSTAVVGSFIREIPINILLLLLALVAFFLCVVAPWVGLRSVHDAEVAR